MDASLLALAKSIYLQFIFIFRILYSVMVFLAFQDQMACQACQDRKDPRERKAQKGRSVKRDRKECRVLEETEGAEGLPGRVGSKEPRE